jgi:hypothetical protein
VRAEWLTIVGDPDAWRSIGLTVGADGLIPLLGTSLRLVSDPASEPQSASGPRLRRDLGDPVLDNRDANEPGPGVTAWALSGLAEPGPTISIDGLHTEVVERGDPVYAEHPLGASSLDHVVVLTPELERTSAAIMDATGSDLRRIRELGPMRQGFHRMGERGSGALIVELVERPDIPPGPAAFWGVVLIVDDLDAAFERIGADRISPPKDAVQPGRRIATVRAEVGLGLPVALMTP